VLGNRGNDVLHLSVKFLYDLGRGDNYIAVQIIPDERSLHRLVSKQLHILGENFVDIAPSRVLEPVRNRIAVEMQGVDFLVRGNLVYAYDQVPSDLGKILERPVRLGVGTRNAAYPLDRRTDAHRYLAQSVAFYLVLDSLRYRIHRLLERIFSAVLEYHDHPVHARGKGDDLAAVVELGIDHDLGGDQFGIGFSCRCELDREHHIARRQKVDLQFARAFYRVAGVDEPGNEVAQPFFPDYVAR